MTSEERNATFIITREDLNADPISVVTDGLTIGRLESCELRLNHRNVSRIHAGIKRTGGRFYLFALSRSSGTTLNSRVIDIESPAVLADGDVIQIGPFLVHIALEDDALCLHVRCLPYEQREPAMQNDLDQVPQELTVFWARLSERETFRASTLVPSLPPSTGLKKLNQTLHHLLRRVIAGISQRDPVDFTVFSPPVVRSGEIFMVQVFAHRPDQAQVASQLAKEFDAETARRGFTSLEDNVERGEMLGVHLSLPDLGFSDYVRVRWKGEPRAVPFDVLVPSDVGKRNVVGTVMISKERVPLGHIKFKLTVEETGTVRDAAKNVPSGEAARRYRKAFISYASQDRAEVTKRVQMLARLKINYFQDVLDLEPGARWQKELYRHIDDSDLFLLFWSSAAKQSPWVIREVNYALKLQNSSAMMLPEIIPVIIEGPPPVDPPPELAHLHFNDYLVYFMYR